MQINQDSRKTTPIICKLLFCVVSVKRLWVRVLLVFLPYILFQHKHILVITVWKFCSVDWQLHWTLMQLVMSTLVRGCLERMHVLGNIIPLLLMDWKGISNGNLIAERWCWKFSSPLRILVPPCWIGLLRMDILESCFLWSYNGLLRKQRRKTILMLFPIFARHMLLSHVVQCLFLIKDYQDAGMC